MLGPTSLATFSDAIKLIDSEYEPVFLAGIDGIKHELCKRLEKLGYAHVDEDAVPDEMRGMLTAYGFTAYGIEHVKDFFTAQKFQMEELKGRRKPLEAFSNKFSELHEHHSKIPLEALHILRMFLSDPRNDFEAEKSTLNLFELYEMLGIMTFSDKGLVRPTAFGATNVPFLFDMILHERGATARH